MLSEWRDASRGPAARIHFPPPATHTNRITATDRVPADEQLGKPECRWVGGNADDDHSQRNPPPCLPAPPSSLPKGGLPGPGLGTSATTGFAMHDDEGRQMGW